MTITNEPRNPARIVREIRNGKPTWVAYITQDDGSTFSAPRSSKAGAYAWCERMGGTVVEVLP